MSYTIQYIPKNQFQSLKEAWKELEKGKDMSLFQTYDWNKALNTFYIPDSTKNYEAVYAIVKKEGATIIIAPLWVFKNNHRFINKKGLYVTGRESWSDYLNLIYNVFDSNALIFLLKEIAAKYSIKHFVFEQLQPNTELYHFIKETQHITSQSQTTCVSLELPTAFEDYQKQLSKNSRQNIRTAYNRLQKDGISLRFKINDTAVDKDLCMEMRSIRLNKKYKKVSKFRELKYRIEYKLRFHYLPFTPMLHYEKSMTMTAYAQNNSLCAFFNYAIDDERKCIIILGAGTSEQFARYSPAILLMHHFIEHAITMKYQTIDFTRGDEKYKFALGGKSFDIQSIEFDI